MRQNELHDGVLILTTVIRHIHSLRAGDKIEIRGPIRTCQVPLDEYDQIAMVCLHD